MNLRTFSAAMVSALLTLVVLTALFVAIDIPVTEGATVIDTDITGGSDLWDVAGSPYLVNKNVTVQNGVTLFIDSGVQVRFDTGVHLFVEGGLYVNGSMGSLVTFTSQEISPAAGDWGSIVFNSTSDIYINDAQIRYATVALDSRSTGEITVRNTTISNSLTGDVAATAGSMPKMLNSAFDETICTADATSKVVVKEFVSAHAENTTGVPEIFCNITVWDDMDQMEDWELTNLTGDAIEIEATAFEINSTGIHYGRRSKIIASTPMYSYNLTQYANVTNPGERDRFFLWSKEPEITGLPSSIMDIVEDAKYDVFFGLSDPDNSTADVNIYVNHTECFVNRTQNSLTFMFRNETKTSGILGVIVTDGIAKLYYDIPFLVAPVNDAPKIALDLDPPILSVTEGMTYQVNLTLSDEETGVGQLVVTSESPYITYNQTAMAIDIMYPDSRYTGAVNVTVSDGGKNATSQLLIQYTEIPSAPVLSPIPAQQGYEETPWSINISQYVMDADYGDSLTFSLDPGRNTSLCYTHITNNTMYFIPIDDMYGTDTFTITVEDQYGLKDTESISLTILPLNDEPILSMPSVMPIAPITTNDEITIGVYYLDVDNEAPLYVNLIMGGVTYNMTLVSAHDGDWTDGDNLFVHKFYVHEPAAISYSFACMDMNGTAFTLPSANFSVVLADLDHTMSEGVVEITTYFTGHDALAAGFTLDVNSTTALHLDTTMASMDLFFEVDYGTIAINWADVEIDYSGLNLSIADEDSMAVYRYTGSDWTKLAQTSPDTSTKVLTANISASGTYGVFADIDIHSDFDNDGVEYFEDLFPFDPTEWQDSDDDGIGDNADPDDDNDGWTDLIESTAGTDKFDNTSVPIDTDSDGLFDYEDPDDDNDGMNDSWEAAYSGILDPKDPTDADDDPDGDGKTNLEEFQAGTDPTEKDASTDTFEYSWLIILLIVVIVVIVIIAGIMYYIKRDSEAIEQEQEEAEEEPEPEPPVKVSRKKGKKKGKKKEKLVAYARYDVTAMQSKKSSKKKKIDDDEVDWGDDDDDDWDDDEDEEMDLLDRADEAEFDDDELDEIEEEDDIEEEDLDVPTDDFVCPECGEEVDEDADECIHCGAEFEEP